MLPEIALEPLDPGALLDPSALAALPFPGGASASISAMFRISGAQAPGLHCLGASVSLSGGLAEEFGADGFSATGKGASHAAAEVSLIGEIFETLSQIDFGAERPQPDAFSDHVEGGWIGQKLAAVENVDMVDWLSARHAATGAKAAFPADLCLRRAQGRRRIAPSGALSAGCAAGADLADATSRAIRELVERNAAALWWLAGSPPRIVSPDSRAGQDGSALLAGLGYRFDRRTVRFLDISGEGPATVAAAVSFVPGGGQLATGIAAGGTLRKAVVGAALEMAQMELSGALARLKAAEGRELSAPDLVLLERDRLDAMNCALLQSTTVAPDRSGDASDEAPLASRLLASGLDVYLVDLTHPILGVPVVRALAPDFQPFARDVRTKCFSRALARHGGGDQHHGGAALYI